MESLGTDGMHHCERVRGGIYRHYIQGPLPYLSYSSGMDDGGVVKTGFESKQHFAASQSAEQKKKT